MNLKDRILDPASPVKLFELVPPARDKVGAIDQTISEVSAIRHLADAVNLPEIHDESRDGAERTAKFVPRIEPRVLGTRIGRELQVDIVVNRCVVHDVDLLRWLRET